MEGADGNKFILTTMWDLAPFKAILALTFIATIVFINTYLTVIETLSTKRIATFHAVRLLKDYTHI
jgi:hypothetical protein